MSSSSIFTKNVDVSDGGLSFEVEVAKAKGAASALSSLPFATTPELLGHDSSTGKLEFERAPRLERLRADTSETWFARLGESLGVIHDQLILPEKLRIIRRRDRGQEGTVVVHGDFCLGNIGMGDGKLVIFDWGLRPWTREVFTIASPGLDLAAFVAPWVTPNWWDPRLPVRKLRTFLDAYLSVVNRDSVVGTLAMESMEEAMLEQLLQTGRRVYARRGLRRVFHHAKTVTNIWRLSNGLQETNRPR